MPLHRDHPALQGLARSAYPFGFPLDDQLHRASNTEASTPTTEGVSSATPAPDSTCTPSKLKGIPLRPAPAVSFGGLPGENSSRPQFFFVNQPLEGGSHFPASYAATLEAVAPAGSGSTQLRGILHVPMHSRYPVSVVPQPLDANIATNAGPPTYRKPFTLRKHVRNSIRKSDKGKGS